jgi:hypothetical protein
MDGDDISKGYQNENLSTATVADGFGSGTAPVVILSRQVRLEVNQWNVPYCGRGYRAATGK